MNKHEKENTFLAKRGYFQFFFTCQARIWT